MDLLRHRVMPVVVAVVAVPATTTSSRAHRPVAPAVRVAADAPEVRVDGTEVVVALPGPATQEARPEGRRKARRQVETAPKECPTPHLVRRFSDRAAAAATGSRAPTRPWVEPTRVEADVAMGPCPQWVLPTPVVVAAVVVWEIKPERMAARES